MSLVVGACCCPVDPRASGGSGVASLVAFLVPGCRVGGGGAGLVLGRLGVLGQRMGRNPGSAPLKIPVG